VGGRGHLLGPILGAITVNALKSYATRAFAEQWLYFLGGLFILVTLFLPKGLVGIPEQLRDLKTRFRRKPNGAASSGAKESMPASRPATAKIP
jgi:urea transport system permease protein